VNDSPTWIDALLGSLLTLVAFMLNLYRRKVDRMEEQHAASVTRDELEKYMDRIREERQRMHEENIERLSAIGSDIRAIHMRIDRVFGK